VNGKVRQHVKFQRSPHPTDLEPQVYVSLTQWVIIFKPFFRCKNLPNHVKSASGQHEHRESWDLFLLVQSTDLSKYFSTRIVLAAAESLAPHYVQNVVSSFCKGFSWLRYVDKDRSTTLLS